ncbi:MAG: Radical SAM domain protein [Parcubacteria group bacterium GW2011_GWA2_38_13]|nr:MAG: Radical SAM domain protein [Parcubacteria group bacterium GW2011_GWA2_38_13]
MITLGKEIIPLKKLLGPPWSEFAFMLRYLEGCILLNSIASTVIICDEVTTKQVLANQITKLQIRVLRQGHLIAETSDDDKTFFAKSSAKVYQHLKQSSVTTLLLVVTDCCNLCCTYCFENLNKFSKRQSMDINKMKEAVDYFLALDKGEKSIFFYGGEPLIEWKKVRHCIEYIRARYKNRKISIQITTNGTLRPDGLIDFCKKHDIAVGVSIDGPSKIMNAARKSKTQDLDVFELSFELMRNCRKAGVKCAALCTVTRESAQFLDEIADFFIREKIGGLGFNLSIKRAGESIEEDLLFWDTLGYQMSIQYQKLLAHGILEPRGIRYLRGIAESRFTIAECDAGYKGQLIVNSEGLIGPCQAFLHDKNYWIPMEDRLDIQTHPLWLMFSQGTTLEIESCKTCPFMGTCGGGCRYNRNNFGLPNLNFCQYIRSFLYHTLSSFERG